ncbi:MAG: METTL5 family protein [Candidatus Methanomethylophilaceae archaeon]
MKKRDLEMQLQKLRPMVDPEAALEQYSTPANIAADVLFQAFANGDISDRTVLDLGCGNGIFALGAWLLGAEKVTGVDISEKALDVARTNAEDLGADIDWILSNVRSFSERADTVLMNPPFGSQRRGADRPFLETAIIAAPAVYSLHMAETLPVLEKFAQKKGREVSFHKEYKYGIPHLFTFHRKVKESIDIVMIIIR